MKLGFTGTRKGMTPKQIKCVQDYLIHHNWVEAHHGACIGADTEFHQLVISICGDETKLVLHPPKDTSRTDFSKLENREQDIWLPPEDFLMRNHAIVEAADYILVAPGTEDPIVRSGTWATFRYARALCKPVTLCTPSGHKEFFSPYPEIELEIKGTIRM